MKKIVIFLFLNCLILSAIAAQEAKDINVSKKLRIKAFDSNEPNVTYRQVYQQPNDVKKYKFKNFRPERPHRQNQDFEVRLAGEYSKHRRRIAILNRIRQLAQEEERSEIIAKVDSLVTLENERHSKIITRLHRRPSRNIPAEPNK